MSPTLSFPSTDNIAQLYLLLTKERQIEPPVREGKGELPPSLFSHIGINCFGFFETVWPDGMQPSALLLLP